MKELHHKDLHIQASSKSRQAYVKLITYQTEIKLNKSLGRAILNIKCIGHQTNMSPQYKKQT